jgi:hypothetical protein
MPSSILADPIYSTNYLRITAFAVQAIIVKVLHVLNFAILSHFNANLGMDSIIPNSWQKDYSLHYSRLYLHFFADSLMSSSLTLAGSS